MTPDEYRTLKERSVKAAYIARPECVQLISTLVEDNRALIKFIDEWIATKGDQVA